MLGTCSAWSRFQVKDFWFLVQTNPNVSMDSRKHAFSFMLRFLLVWCVLAVQQHSNSFSIYTLKTIGSMDCCTKPLFKCAEHEDRAQSMHTQGVCSDMQTCSNYKHVGCMMDIHVAFVSKGWRIKPHLKWIWCSLPFNAKSPIRIPHVQHKHELGAYLACCEHEGLHIHRV